MLEHACELPGCQGGREPRGEHELGAAEAPHEGQRIVTLDQANVEAMSLRNVLDHRDVRGRRLSAGELEPAHGPGQPPVSVRRRPRHKKGGTRNQQQHGVRERWLEPASEIADQVEAVERRRVRRGELELSQPPARQHRCDDEPGGGQRREHQR